MTAITVANNDGSILSAVDTALTGATLLGATVFKSVTSAMTEAQAEECQLKGSTPRVVILYDGTSETMGVQGERQCVVSLRLYIATKLSSGVDETARLAEMMRLVNLAKNAIESATWTDVAGGFGDEDNFHKHGPDWSDTEPQESDKPWVSCILPVTFGYGITSTTSH